MTSEIKHYNTNKPVKVEINDQNINEATTKVEIQKLNRNTGKMEPYKKHAPIKITRKTAVFSHNFTTKDEGLYHMKVSAGRSEEHTSELQSRGHLVCRLLLEKKKSITIID